MPGEHTPPPSGTPPHAPVLTRAQVRALDAAAERELAIPGILLMEHAAAALEAAALRLLQSLPAGPALALILCGPGNNGGDGYALARRLHLRTQHELPHLRVEALPLAPAHRAHGDAAINRTIAERLGLVFAEAPPTIAPNPPHPPSTAADPAHHAARPWPAARARALNAPALLLIDALLGTGLDRPLSPETAEACAWINHLRRQHPRAQVLAVDLPTGLDADTAQTWSNHTVRADLTVTLAAMKPALLRPESRPWTGTIEVAPIGVPESFVRTFQSHATN